jgi:hypothetical protein
MQGSIRYSPFLIFDYPTVAGFRAPEAIVFLGGSFSRPYLAEEESALSMRRRRLYFATRSLRQGAPVLINAAFAATERSASVVSSVSPLRWEGIKS